MRSRSTPWSRGTHACAVAVSMVIASAVADTATAAAEGPGVMYRCPGNDYNNTLSAREAKERGCKTLEGAPITVIQSVKPRPVPIATGNGAASANPGSGSRIDPAEQRARDSDSRRILEAELQREQERLAQMKAEYNNGEPDRLGNEKNYQKYLDRVSDMKTAITRKEIDIAAIKREIQKLPS